ncbi:MAG: CBS domain-containing protein [Planctomycetota bacterium]
MLRAQDVMNTNVVVVPGDATVEEAIRSLLKHHVSGAPIVDEQGCIVGIISEFQLLEAIYRPEVKRERVRDVMTKDVITVTEDAALSEIANLLLLHRIRRVPVVRDGKMVGLISRPDLLRCTVEPEDVQDETSEEVKACSGAR